MTGPHPVSLPPAHGQTSAARPLVDYLVARTGVPPASGLAYDYVLGGDGVYLAAENRLLRVRVPVARARLRGLPPVYAECSLKHGRLPLRLWDQLLLVARALGAAGHEVLLTVEHDAGEGYRLCLPRQVVGATHVAYAPGAGGEVVLELHSHHRYAARFSATDDADEQRLCLYGVVGRLDADRPHVALRAGAYGHYLPVPWETVFAGDPAARARVWDAHDEIDGAPETQETEEVHDESEEAGCAAGGRS
jgi:PRTRC genetic system protein A